MNFNEFKTAVQEQFKTMSKKQLFVVDIDRDTIWDAYLAGFPEGTNPMFRERTEHDCQCCKQFIRTAGKIVSIVDNKLVSIWDIDIPSQYQDVADAMAALIKSKPIYNAFLTPESQLGVDKNRKMLEDGEVETYEHFYVKVPIRYISHGDLIGTSRGQYKTTKDVFERSVEETTREAIETVLELIEQGSLYRGAEHKLTVKEFLRHQMKFDQVYMTEGSVDNFCWETALKIGPAARFRNTVIGTLMTDISDGVDLTKAVKSFEDKVAPANYKRPTALITKGMIEKAHKKVAELGIESSLYRRYALPQDITINNVIFADRTAKQDMGLFEELAASVPDKPKDYTKVDEVDIETFIKDILPKAESIEFLFENKHVNNLVSLISPSYPEAKPIFKWGNNFSWAYNGDVTDSLKERVKKAGGSVTGVLRCSLAWYNTDDLDIHVIEPGGNEIFYGGKCSTTGGNLDVDMNAGRPLKTDAVENITWPDLRRMREGVYKVFIHQFSKRGSDNVGFEAEIEYDGVVHEFFYPKAQQSKRSVAVAEFEFTHKDGIKFIKSLPSTASPVEAWNISTHKFHRVSMVMNSPNHWDGEETGNKHWFFMLENCVNPDSSRGFFNEFLRGDLTEYRKVFEVLSGKMKTDVSDTQLSGLGFSSTVRAQVVCRVTGSFARTIKINI